MDATENIGGRRRHTFSIKIKPILLPICCPTLFKSFYLLRSGDTESRKRKDHGANTDVRVCAFTNMPATRAPKDRGADVAPGSNPLKHRIQVIAQVDDCVEGHALMPLGAEVFNHFRKPHSLRIASSHICTIVGPLCGAH